MGVSSDKAGTRKCPECGGKPGDGLFGGSRLTSYWSRFNDKRRASRDHMNAHLCKNKFHAVDSEPRKK